jgi:hypothetical protein
MDDPKSQYPKPESPVFFIDLTSSVSFKGEATPVPIHFKENLKEILNYLKLVTVEYPKSYQSL